MTGRGRRSGRGAVAVGLVAAALAAITLTAPDPASMQDAGAPTATSTPGAPTPEIPAPEITAPPSTAGSAEDASGGVPVLVRIPEISVRSDVVPVGVDEDNNVVIPEDIEEIGWYRYASDPADLGGSTVLVGHRDGVESGRGAFYALGDLVRGDEVTVRTADGARHRYTVRDARSISKARFAEWAPTIFGTTGSRRLTLITCGGDYVRSAGGYQENVVVTAVPVVQAPAL